MNCLCLFPLTEIYSVIYVDGCEESEIWFEIIIGFPAGLEAFEPAQV
jgi:hypothetical protein